MMKTRFFVSTAMVGCLTAFGALADSTDICAGGTAASGTAPAYGTAGTHYMVTAIAPKCSSNVILKGIDGTSGAWYAVGSVSVKGKNSFKGHTNGGAVMTHVACAVPGGCTDGEAGTARSQANTDAGTSS